jgi:16S rRNA (guanine527-N7)-methyltransferase
VTVEQPPRPARANGASVAKSASGANGLDDAENQPPPVPPAPPAAAQIFGATLPVAERYARLLAGPGVARGLLGPHEIPRLWDRHLLNSAVVAELVPHPGSLVDLGSGAGLPGIVLAMLLPDVAVTLLEPMQRRVAFLTECVAVLGLGNAIVLRGRAEDWAGRLAADAVTARAVAPLARLAPLALGLVRPGGIVLAIKGTDAEREMAAARRVLRRAGVAEVAVVRAGRGKVDPAATVVRLTAGRPAGGVARPPGEER